MNRTRTAEAQLQAAEFWREALLLAVLTLVGLGILMAVSVEGPGKGAFPALHAKALRVAPALLAFLVASRLPLERLHPFVLPAFILTLLLCLLPHFLGREIKGSSRWIHIAGLSFQPVELLKPVSVLAMAEALERRQRYMSEFTRGVLPVVAIPAASAVVLLSQPDVGHAFFLLAIGGGLLVIGGLRFRHSLGLMFGSVALLALAFVLYPHALRRVLEFFSSDLGYQMKYSLAAFADGGLLGQGIGQGWFQYGWLPETRNDFVLPILGNELGLAGSLLVVSSFGLLLVAALRIARGARSRWSFLVALGLTMTVVLQASMNILGVTNSIPEKGIDLPFLSSGGTNLFFALASVGILANIAATGRSVRGCD
ncbi:MAG: FtsW/RodA/SpoVE family cell cycle protein [Planctomycetota bacterium]